MAEDNYELGIRDRDITHKLIQQVRADYISMGKTDCVCPMCGDHPVMYNTSHGARTIITCRCRYITDVEINL